MKILLINPLASGIYDQIGLRFPPLGLAYIAAMLREKKGYEVSILDLNVQENIWEEISKGWDIIGLSGDTSRYPIAMKIAKKIKQYYKSPIIIMGGPHVSFFVKETLDTKVVDYIVRGEGEIITLNLIDAIRNKKDLHSIDGIAFREDDNIVETKPFPIIRDVDSIPLPARDLLPMERYRTLQFEGKPITTVLTSRGCPFNCYFCSSSQFFGLKWRTRSIKSIVDEIELLVNKYNYYRFAFIDDNFTLNPKRVIQISKEILDRGLDIKWWAFSRVDEILKSEEMVKWMARSGCKMLFLGIESVSEEILKEYNKRISAEDSVKAIELLRKYGIRIWGSFIIGALEETRKMILNTIKFAKILDPDIAQFSILTPFPGTRLYDDVVKKGLIIQKDWSYYDGAHATIRTQYLSPPDIAKLAVKAYISFYGRPKRLIKLIPELAQKIARIPANAKRTKHLIKKIEEGP